VALRWEEELLGVVGGGAPLLFLLKLLLQVLALLGTLLELDGAPAVGVHADEFNLLGVGVLWLLSLTALWNLLGGDALLSLTGDHLMTLTEFLGLPGLFLAAAVFTGVTLVFPGVMFPGALLFPGVPLGGAPPPPLR